MKGYKRQYRDLSPDTKKKISEALKGRTKTEEVRRRISKGLKEYWRSVAWRATSDV